MSSEALRLEIEKAEVFCDAVLAFANSNLKRIGDPPWKGTAISELRLACINLRMALETAGEE